MNRVLRRIVHAFGTFVAAVTFTFGIVHSIPGGPAGYLKTQLAKAGAGMTALQTAALVEEYTNANPDKPLWQQYIDYLIAVFHGDLGMSVTYQKPAASLLFSALPWTLFYMTIALFLIYLISILGGAYIAYRSETNTDSVISVVSIVLNSTPYYVAGLLLIYLLGYQYDLFPTGGRMSSGVDVGWNVTFVADVLHHAALPIMSMVITGFGMKLLLMRGNSVSVLGEDYVRVARLRGLSQRRIAWRYVSRNAILPMYTQVILSIGFLFSGSTILETIFSYKGLGWYMFQSIQASDYPLMMATFIVITIAVLIGIIFADLTYDKIDPRLGSDEDEAF